MIRNEASEGGPGRDAAPARGCTVTRPVPRRGALRHPVLRRRNEIDKGLKGPRPDTPESTSRLHMTKAEKEEALAEEEFLDEFRMQARLLPSQVLKP